MSELQEYKCPCCGGAIEFNSSIQKMKCPYCDTEFEMEALAAYDDEIKNDTESSMDWETDFAEEWKDSEASDLQSYICNSCGGEIIADETTAAASCPYCDNPIVIKGNVAGELRPKLVIPFKLDKKAAKEQFSNHLKNKKFLPAVFKTEAHIDEIKGVYVPYWLFNTDAYGNIRYRATRVHSWSDRKNNYVKTEYYSVTRAGFLSFDHVPVDGSSRMDDDLMESLEPYDFSEAVDFQTAYLAGYFADKYDVSAEDAMPRANERITNSTVEAFADTVVGYTSVQTEYSNVNLRNSEIEYAMYPVWVLNTTWNGKKYVFAMNGQTGKFVGNLPVDKSVANRWLLGFGALFSAIAFAVMYIIWLI